MNQSKIIVLDLHSVFSNLTKPGREMRGIPVPGLLPYVQNEQERGSTIYFIAGAAHDAFYRQSIERFLEKAGFRSVFVTHGLPDGFDVFISINAFKFDGEKFP